MVLAHPRRLPGRDPQPAVARRASTRASCSSSTVRVVVGRDRSPQPPRCRRDRRAPRFGSRHRRSVSRWCSRRTRGTRSTSPAARAAALADQQLAGVIMWAFGGMAAVIAGAGVFASWLATGVAEATDASAGPAERRGAMTDSSTARRRLPTVRVRQPPRALGRRPAARLEASPTASSITSSPTTGRSCSARSRCTASSSSSLTGVYLTFFFHPGSRDVVYHGSYVPLRGVHMSEAYESTIALSFDVRAGLVVRQIHHWTADVFAAAIVVHLCRIFFTGAFRRPREINWIIGVTMLILVIFNGFAGYSLPDDLLSATGLRIAYSILLSDPVRRHLARVTVLRRRLSGPGDDRPAVHHPRADPARAHRGAARRRTSRSSGGRSTRSSPGPGAPSTTSSARGSGRPTRRKSAGLFAAVFAVVAALGGLAQINPLWLYGPYRTGAVTTAAQPDWYMGWLEGALRIFPAWRVHLLAPHDPRAVLARRRAARPHLRAACTRGRSSRPRSRATTPNTSCSTDPATGRCAPRSAPACSPSTSCCSAPDRRTSSPNTSNAPIPAVDRTFRILLLVAPLVVAAITWKWCHDLSAIPPVDAAAASPSRARHLQLKAVTHPRRS